MSIDHQFIFLWTNPALIVTDESAVIHWERVNSVTEETNQSCMTAFMIHERCFHNRDILPINKIQFK